MKTISFILLILFLSFTTYNLAQEEENNGPLLKHMLKKAKADTLIYAGQYLIPEYLQIKIPDTVYNQSEIEIKKYKLPSVGKVNLFIRSKEKYIYKSRYQIKGHRKADKFLNYLLGKLGVTKSQLESGVLKVNNKQLNFRYDVSGKYHYFIFTTDITEVK